MCDDVVNQADGLSISVNKQHENQLYLRSSPRFIDLPVEIIVHICSYLEAKFVSEVLRNVCLRFHDILSDDSLWHLFVNNRVQSYPVLSSMENEDGFSWEKACVEIDEEVQIWTNEQTLFTTVLKDVHYSSIDAILLMKQGSICVSGSRDRSIAVWDLAQLYDKNERCSVLTPCLKSDAHAGWVWGLTNNDRQLYSCSWDNTVKSWDMESGLTCIDVAECKRVVLSLVCDNHLVVAGLHSGFVLMLDPRAISNTIDKYKVHTCSILSLAMSEKYIISASEDRTISVWDKRAGKTIKKELRISGKVPSLPMHVTFAAGCIFIGDSKNSIYICDPVDFSITPFYTVDEDSSVHLSKNCGIRNNYGSVIAGFEDGTIHVFQPTSPTTEIRKFKSSMPEVLSLDYQSNVLAVGGESALQVWIPQNKALAQQDLL